MSFRDRAAAAIADPGLHEALHRATDRFVEIRKGGDDLANLEGLKAAARWVRHRTLERLPEILARFADEVEAAGGVVHWAADAEEANRIVRDLAVDRGVRSVVKTKSMLTEELGLNDALEAAGLDVVETDLGEWILQLAGDRPSHILGPAIHFTKERIAEVFSRVAGRAVPPDPATLCSIAREELRARFLAADLGISGCNFAVAETGTVVLVTNEGNGRMVTSVPPIHVVVMGMERIVETWEELDLVMTLLPRSATGQRLSVYTTQITGPRRPGEVDGPDELHVVVVDNGRSAILGTPSHEMLHCIRCSACLNVCPVYRQVGGHAYGSVYSGPMGAVLTPLLRPDDPEARELAYASSLCSACHEVCPVGIPLQDLLLEQRRRNRRGRRDLGFRAWAATWSRPATYRASIAAIRTGAGRLPDALVPTSWKDGRRIPRPRGRFDLRRRLERGEI
ncbi:MAG TPA: iron-sulfur cluster-binding protein [Actinobacteria bacterium]|nr:iron-sulfur cluster-binding protein [Actinomycetota bacterium]